MKSSGNALDGFQVIERCLTLNDHLARGRKHTVLLSFKKLTVEKHSSIPKLSIFIKEENETTN